MISLATLILSVRLRSQAQQPPGPNAERAPGQGGSCVLFASGYPGTEVPEVDPDRRFVVVDTEAHNG
jgi:hypothetical protein